MIRCKDSTRTLHGLGIEIKADDVDDKGRFSGYASVFGVIDAYREVVAAGAFKQTIKDIKRQKKLLPALWSHRSDEPIGGYDELEEDEHGLRVSGFLLVEEITRAKEVHSLMKKGIVRGLSIGYYVIDDSWNDKERVRTLKKLDLVEVSPVMFPANAEAQIDAVKQKLLRSADISVREFEQLLREQGFSRTRAESIAQSGFKELAEGSGEPRRSTAPPLPISDADNVLRLLNGLTAS